MPNRLVCAAILVAWSCATVALVRRDILPDLLIGPPPDLRTVVRAGQEHDELTRWSILVADDRDDGNLNLRAVGQAETQSRRARDGWFRMMSKAWFDSGAMLRGTALEGVEKEHVEIKTVSDIDPAGNLDSFRAAVRLGLDAKDTLVISGIVRDNDLRVTAQGPLPILTWTRSFPYLPRQMVAHELGPLDRMPNLQVGQRWKSQVVSPLTGRVEEAQIAVERKSIITWDGNPVTTLEVVTHLPPLSARTWVRPDGLVLRQEVPFPLVRLILERLPQRFIGPSARGLMP
jgi:hypothetical protein